MMVWLKLEALFSSFDFLEKPVFVTHHVEMGQGFKCGGKNC